jgi:hypothetical protein
VPSRRRVAWDTPEGVGGAAAVQQEMKRVRRLEGAPGSYVYSATVTANWPPMDYIGRVVPFFDDVAIPLEGGRIIWQR